MNQNEINKNWGAKLVFKTMFAVVSIIIGMFTLPFGAILVLISGAVAHHIDLQIRNTKVEKEVREEVENKIIILLKEFSNTPLDKRGTGWDWLIKIKSLINNK